MANDDPQSGNDGHPAAAEGAEEDGAQAMEETSGRGELSPRQERAIAALMTEQTILRAAQAAGVGERTLHKWLDRPNFAAEYRRVRREAFRQAVGMSQRFATAAVATLAKVLADPQSPYSAKVAAATALLKFGREGIEIEDLQVRVEDLERQAAGAGVVDQPSPEHWASRRTG